MLNEQNGVTVVASSDGQDDILLTMQSTKPDVILMDLGLECQNCLDVAKAIKGAYASSKIIGMGLVPSQSDIMELVQAGADGFILKNATLTEVTSTIRVVFAGDKVLPTSMASSLFSQVAEYALLKNKKNLKVAVRMTQREQEVIALISDGLSNKDIGLRLNIATFTVKSHVHNIMEKLALHSRLQIANHAREEKD